MEKKEGEKSGIDKFKEEEKQNEIKQFIRAYELKQKAFSELAGIYAKNAMNTHFSHTMKAAVALIALPALTNIYYSFRPHSILAGVMPYAVPLLCFYNYCYFVNKDFQSFCLTNDPDAEKAREQFDILFEFSYYNSSQNAFMDKI